MSSTVRKCFLVLLIFLLQVTSLLKALVIVRDRNAFLFDNAQLISSDFRVLKSHTVYILFSCFSVKLCLPSNAVPRTLS